MKHFLEYSIEELDGNYVWHFKCKSCSRFFSSDDQSLKDNNAYKLACPKCNNEIVGFISCKEKYKRFILSDKKLSICKEMTRYENEKN